jgi:hypothetical protein
VYYTLVRERCQGLLFGNSEDTILTGLAHARDGVLFLRKSITERGSLTLTGDAGCLSDSTHTGYTRELGEHLLDALMLEGGFKRVFFVLHVCIIPYLEGDVKG